MTYRVLAQKYRPQVFDDIVGQETVTRTLKNAVLSGRLANAYLFSGPRGVGKTSAARLLAKTLNCEKPPAESPCNKCASCEEIALASNIDVLEIDGAYNRGIDEIRALRENVKFSPSKGKFRIYIIDEVHMLTMEAFNALLKTLEEPPAHVKFIFATTEPHKIPATIMSRCQKFDFKRISPALIFDRLSSIVKKEKIDIEENAARMIARSADGSLRDALVVLDQMVSFSGNKITSFDVAELMGVAHSERICELAQAAIDGHTGEAAVLLDTLISDGKDPVFITMNLVGHFRDLMILKAVGKPTSDMAFSEEELTRLTSQSEKLSIEEILYILQNLTNCINLMKGVISTRAPLEITLIRLAKRGDIMALSGIMEKLEKMVSEDVGSSAVVGAIHVPLRPGVDAKTQAREDPSESKGQQGSVDFGSSSAHHWKAVMNYVKNKKMSAFTFLEAARPVEFTKDKVVIGFDKDHAFNKEALEAGSRDVIEEAIHKTIGVLPRVEFAVLEFLGSKKAESYTSLEKKAEVRSKMKPIIEKAMDIFGGQVVRDVTEDE